MSDTQRHFPACFVEFPPSTEGRRCAFFLAAEEYIADTLPEDNYFFTWQLAPTVVMGRNQVAHQEINIDFCRREGIDIVRRRSGGGAIFADRNNVFNSLVTGGCPVETLFEEYAHALADALKRLGAPASVSGRNDIVLEGEKKICGNAFYHKPNRNIAHGTMLYDTNPRLMQGALNPDVSKLEAKGVKSVRSRIGLLKDYLNIGADELRQQIRLLLTDRSIRLTDEDVQRIGEIEQSYYTDDYLYGTPTHADIVRSQRIEGCGTVEMHIALAGSIITGIRLAGDYFDLSDAPRIFAKAFEGVPLTPDSIRRAIEEHHPERAIRGLDTESLINLFIS